MVSALMIALRVMERPWEWGTADCCTSACDVFRDLWGIDPMARLRGKYCTRNEALKLIRQHGGFLQMCTLLADESGLVRSHGRPGDIGVAHQAERHWALSICYAPGCWAAKSETGMTTVSEIVRSWRAP